MPNLPIHAAPAVAQIVGGTAVLVAGNVVQLIINNGKDVVNVTVNGTSLIDSVRQNKRTAEREHELCKAWEDILDQCNPKYKDIQELIKKLKDKIEELHKHMNEYKNSKFKFFKSFRSKYEHLKDDINQLYNQLALGYSQGNEKHLEEVADELKMLVKEKIKDLLEQIKNLNNETLRVQRLILLEQPSWKHVIKVFGETFAKEAVFMLENGSVKECKANGDANEALKTIVEYGFFGVSKSLKKIDLRDSNLNAEGAKHLAEVLTASSALECVDLRSNQIGDEVACCLSEALKKNKSLKSLTLDWGKMSRENRIRFLATGHPTLNLNDPMVHACQERDLDSVKALVESHDAEKTGMSVEEMVSKEGKDSFGASRTPLQMAAMIAGIEIAQYLVKSCPTVDLIGQTDSYYGNNSLHYAAQYSSWNVQMLQWLIDNYNGDIKQIINHQSNGGWTPLDSAYNGNHSPIKNDLVSLLRKYGGKANYYDKNGEFIGKGNGDLNWSPLVSACAEGDLDSVKAMVEDHDVEKTGMSLDDMVSNEGKNSDGYSYRTPLQMAARYEQFEIVQYLVKSCTTVDLIGQTHNEYGQNSLHLAAWDSKKNVQTLQWLIDNYNGDIKSIINHQSNYGSTPLDLAYGYNDSPIKNDIVSLLRKYGGKANCYDKNGNSVGLGKGDLNN
eukprot:g11910.t1